MVLVNGVAFHALGLFSVVILLLAPPGVVQATPEMLTSGESGCLWFVLGGAGYSLGRFGKEGGYQARLHCQGSATLLPP